MATVADILDFVEALAPLSMKEDWDNVGLNCGHRNRQVHTILVALDPFAAVCREAKSIGAELLLTHHTLLWRPGFLTDRDEQGRNALFLIENGIAHINAHTNLDFAPGGVNDVLAARLGLADVEVVAPSGVDAQGRLWGLVRGGTVTPQPLGDFLNTVKECLGCPGLRYVNSEKPVHRVAVCGGSGGSEMQKVAQAGYDTFVTSDIRYNQAWDAKDLGLNLIDAGHFYTENPVCYMLAEKLRAAFPEISVKVSENHRDCMKFL